ncbi:hypothetical protein C8J57DRAFT_1531593 [Mycena rebaudengoi]|nr:hypothetical protein C8J57DRAFT_1531593 [Mycena rebaudengoi]
MSTWTRLALVAGVSQDPHSLRPPSTCNTHPGAPSFPANRDISVPYLCPSLPATLYAVRYVHYCSPSHRQGALLPTLLALRHQPSRHNPSIGAIPSHFPSPRLLLQVSSSSVLPPDLRRLSRPRQLIFEISFVAASVLPNARHFCHQVSSRLRHISCLRLPPLTMRARRSLCASDVDVYVSLLFGRYGRYFTPHPVHTGPRIPALGTSITCVFPLVIALRISPFSLLRSPISSTLRRHRFFIVAPAPSVLPQGLGGQYGGSFIGTHQDPLEFWFWDMKDYVGGENNLLQKS